MRSPPRAARHTTAAAVSSPAAALGRALVVAALLACGRGEPALPRAAAGPAATDSDSASAAHVARDDFGRPVPTPPTTAAPPARIVSLNPTTTELLFALGAGAHVVGRTRWDVYPDSARLVPDLGDGLRPSVERVLAARPSLVVLYASADNRPAAERLAAAGVATLALKIDRIADFRRAALLLGAAVGESARAGRVVDSVDRTLDRVRAATAPLPRPRVLYAIFGSPLYTIGAGSYLDELVTVAGGRNVYADSPLPSPQVSLEDVMRRDPDVVLGAAPSVAKILAAPSWRSLRAVREGRVHAVDDALVERPSVRLGEAALHLARLLHPDARP